MKIEKITLTNFKGVIGTREHLFYNNTLVLGDNETGKTTIKDAYYWLFWNYSPEGTYTYNYVKPKNLKTNNNTSNLHTSVECIIDGVAYKKVMRETYKRKRDSNNEKILSGHDHDYYINGIKKNTLRDFAQEVQAVFGDDKLRFLLTDVEAINTKLDWVERRTLLIGENTKLEQLTSEISDLKKNKKSITEQRDDIAPKIDELSEWIKGVKYDQGLIDQYEKEIEKLRAKKLQIENSNDKNKKEELLISLRSNESKIMNMISDEKRKEMNNIQSEISNIDQKIEQITIRHKKDLELNDQKLNKEYYNNQKLEKELNSKKTKIEIEIKNLEHQTNDLESKRKKLLEKYHSINDSDIPEGICPTCKQYSEDLEEKYLKSRSEALEKIKSDGVLIKEKIENLTKEKHIKSDELTLINDQIKEIPIIDFVDVKNIKPEEIEKLENDKLSLLTKKPSINKQLEKDLAEVKEKIKNISEEKNNLSEEIQIEVNNILTEIQGIKKVLDEELKKREQYNNELEYKDKIDLHKQKVTELSNLIMDKEKEIDTKEKEIQNIANDIEKPLNARFSITEWKLLHKQVDGEIKACCVATMNGLEYALLNDAAKLNVNIDIINTLSKEHNLNYPLWIDNAEKSLNIMYSYNQMIKMYAVKSDLLVIDGEKINESKFIDLINNK